MSRRARTTALAGTVISGALVLASCYAPAPQDATHPHHDDPFLTCVRARESGDDYTIDSPDRQYHGAYQFYQSTWDATADHAQREELRGVDPHGASEYDQDDLAWHLYQWQGRTPWNGACP